MTEYNHSSESFVIFIATDDLPYLKCPLHTVLKLTPVAYGESTTLFLSQQIQTFSFVGL